MKQIIRIIALATAFTFVFAACNGNDVVDESTQFPTSDSLYVTEYVPELVTNLHLTSTKDTVTQAEIEGEVSDDIVTEAEITDSVETQPAEVIDHPRVKVTMENGRSFIIELYPEYAPATCANFIKLVNEGFYDGLTFHRVVRGFVAQGGDPEGTGMGGSSESIPGEFYSNGFDKNIISHTRGVISMARSSDPDSASSQFFICYEDCSDSLDGSYAAFGLVVEGMEVVDDFLLVERTLGNDRALSKPVTPIVIAKAEVIG